VLWSGGPRDGRFEIEYLAVGEVDESGRIAAFVLFDLDDARAAQREAWRRWAVIEPHVAAVVKPIGDILDAFSEKDAARFRAALADDLVVEDHRLAGMGRLEGADAYTESVTTLWAIAPESRLEMGWRWPRVDRHGAITVALRTGTVPGGGGDFESECLILFLVANGRITRSELFEMDSLDKVLARFEALRGAPPGPDPLRIPPNLAVRATDRLDHAFVASDLPAVHALFHPDFVFEDRGKKALVKGDVETLIESAQYLLSLPSVRLDVPLLGTMGDRVAIQHELWSNGADRDGFAIERIRYVEVDADGHFHRWILFDSEDRADAFAEAQKRFAVGEAADCAAQALLHDLHVVWGNQDWGTLHALIAEDAVIDDYRPLGLGRLGRDGWIESWRVGADLAPDVCLEVLRILVWNEHGRVQLSRVAGTRDGGEFENVLLNLIVYDGQLLRYHEFYDVEDADRAVARFEELCRSSPGRATAAAAAVQIPPNAAVRYLEHWKDTLRSGNADALVGLLDPSFVCEDRRRLVRTTTGRAEENINTAFMIEGGWRPTTTVLATAGDRLALLRWVWTRSDGDAKSEVELLELDELDDAGRFVRSVLFDPEDRGAASDELLERYIAIGADGVPHGSLETLRGFNEHDMERVRRSMTDDFVLVDRRLAGMGRLEGPEAYIESVAALIELIPDVRTEVLYYAAADELGRVTVSRTCGRNREGGEVESWFALVSLYREDKVGYFELFELEQLDAALSRFEELRGSSEPTSSKR
jgi:ketosteroid isomerase-like protein